jgi:hypothetical protein
VKAIRVGATDILSAGSVIPPGRELEPLEIVIGAGAGAVGGRVADNRSRPVPNVNVVLVPAPALRSTRPDLYKAVAADANGGFDLRDVPPGDYTLFAWDFAPENIWQDAAFLRNHEQAGKTVRVEDGGKIVGIEIGPISTR